MFGSTTHRTILLNKVGVFQELLTVAYIVTRATVSTCSTSHTFSIIQFENKTSTATLTLSQAEVRKRVSFSHIGFKILPNVFRFRACRVLA